MATFSSTIDSLSILPATTFEIVCQDLLGNFFLCMWIVLAHFSHLLWAWRQLCPHQFPNVPVLAANWLAVTFLAALTLCCPRVTFSSSSISLSVQTNAICSFVPFSFKAAAVCSLIALPIFTFLVFDAVSPSSLLLPRQSPLSGPHIYSLHCQYIPCHHSLSLLKQGYHLTW